MTTPAAFPNDMEMRRRLPVPVGGARLSTPVQLPNDTEMRRRLRLPVEALG